MIDFVRRIGIYERMTCDYIRSVSDEVELSAVELLRVAARLDNRLVSHPVWRSYVMRSFVGESAWN